MANTITHISEVNEEIIALLLEADPSREQINQCLSNGQMYGIYAENNLMGCMVITESEPQVLEIKNIAVNTRYRGQGIGTRLLQYAITEAQNSEAHTLRICTGNSSIDQLKLYQRVGFRITGVIPNHFVDNYDEAIWENDIQCRDLIVLNMPV